MKKEHPDVQGNKSLPNLTSQLAGAALSDLFRIVQRGKSKSNEEYDLSFLYSFHWDQPDKQIKEALKVLLCNRESDYQPEQGVSKTKKKAGERQLNTQAALEAAKIRWLLAINPNTPPPVLEHLTRNANLQLLERIAENPRTHSTTLARLATHEDAQVRAAVGENINTSIKTIWKLARDPNPDVRHRIAESYTVPIAVLRVLAEDENPYVSHRAQVPLFRILREVSQLRTA